MTIDDKIRDEKLQHNTNREAEKYQYYHKKKKGKHEYLTGVEILPSDQKRVIEQAKFTYSPLGKSFERQTKTIDDQRKKQIKIYEDNKKQPDTKKIAT